MGVPVLLTPWAYNNILAAEDHEDPQVTDILKAIRIQKAVLALGEIWCWHIWESRAIRHGLNNRGQIVPIRFSIKCRFCFATQNGYKELVQKHKDKLGLFYFVGRKLGLVWAKYRQRTQITIIEG